MGSRGTDIGRGPRSPFRVGSHSSVLAWRIPGMGSLVGCVYGVAQSRTRLKCLSSSSIISHITILNESDSSSTYLSEMAWYNKNRIKRYRFSFDF